MNKNYSFARINMKVPAFGYHFIALIFSLLITTELQACRCFYQPELYINNWNDTELIFEAHLSLYKYGLQISKFVFTPKKIFKGELSKEPITIHLKTKGSHKFTHAIPKIESGQNWIVFAQKQTVGDKVFYELAETLDPEFCALSRPVHDLALTDPYLQFLLNFKTPLEGNMQFKDAEGRVIAKGKYHHGAADGSWKYYDEAANLSLAGRYVNGKREGEWHIYRQHFSGKQILDRKDFYIKGKLYEYHLLYDFGVVRYKESYAGDTTHVLQYSREGVLSYETWFVESQKSRRAIIYFPDGSIKKETYHIDEELTMSQIFNEKGEMIYQFSK